MQDKGSHFSHRAVRSLMLPALVMTVTLLLAGSETEAVSEHWPGHGNSHSEQRFSPLDEINSGNVSRLGLAWYLELPGETSLEATPLEVNGAIYFSGSMGWVYAVEAATGQLLWKYEPELFRDNPREARRIYAVNRGVAYHDGTVFAALKDGRMIALDAEKGNLKWSKSFIHKDFPATSTGAPRAFKGKVIIGTSGADLGSRGYVTTLDANTGELLWRFFTVPGEPGKTDGAASDDVMPMAAKTWSGEWWKFGGGGTAWNGITFDEELNQILIGTGNGGPWSGKYRAETGEDNLFLCSVVAVDADTGAYRWHYQYNPNEVWDWKATSEIILADLEIEGAVRKVMLQAPSNGFFYVIDRYKGELISAEKYAKVNWADRIDLETGRPVERPGIRYEEAPFTLYPGIWGANNWQASSFSPMTGLVYIPYMQIGTTYSNSPIAQMMLEGDPGMLKWRLGINASIHADPQDPMDGKGAIIAWDPVDQEMRWKAEHSFFWNGGTMVTAGDLVFQGNYLGEFAAYHAVSGEKLWSFDSGLGIIAPPISYSVNANQYVVILVGWGGDASTVFAGYHPGWKYGQHPRRLLAFSIDGNAALPEAQKQDVSVNALDDPSLVLDRERVESGELIFSLWGQGACAACHGDGVQALGMAPDLRESPIALDFEAFKSLLRSDVLVNRNMPQYDDLSEEQILDIYHYIRHSARASASGGKQ